MTNEYTGWDNYVKEHQRVRVSELLGYSGPNFEYDRIEQLQKKVKDLEYHISYLKNASHVHTHIHDDVHDLKNKVKDIEDRMEWLPNHRNVDNISLDVIYNKVKDLERIDRDNHNNNWKNIENVLDRVKDLESRHDDEIFDRLEKLEKWQQNHHFVNKEIDNLKLVIKQYEDFMYEHNILCRVDSYGYKIKALEEWKNEHRAEFHVEKGVEHIYAAKAIDELQKKVKDLEESALKNEDSSHEDYIRLVKTFSERISNIEDWRNQETYHSILAKRVSELEEWKISTRLGPAVGFDNKLPNPSGYILGQKDDPIKIDKKVWEHIRYLIEMMDLNWKLTEIKPYNNNVKRWLTEALDAIKKAEGIKDG